MIRSTWLKMHVNIHGNRVSVWDFDAKHEAVQQCLQECQNNEIRDSALWDFWNDKLGGPLFNNDALSVIKNLWICLESAIQDQIDNEEFV